MRSPGIQESWILNYETLMGLSLTSVVLILGIVMFYRRKLAKKIEKQEEVKLEELMNQYREVDAGEDYIRSLEHVETFIGEVFSDGILPETIQLSDALELVDLFGLYLQRIHETTLRENNVLKIENTEENETMEELRAENQLRELLEMENPQWK